MIFHIIKGKPGLIEKKVILLLLVDMVHQGENIPNPIPDHVLTALIIVIFDGNLHIYFHMNDIKFNISCIL